MTEPTRASSQELQNLEDSLREIVTERYPATILTALVEAAGALQLEISSIKSAESRRLSEMAERLWRLTEARADLVTVITGHSDPDGEPTLDEAIVVAQRIENAYPRAR